MTDRHNQDETASLVSQILRTYHEHYPADEHTRQPLKYDEALTGNIIDQVDRYRERPSTSTRRSSRR